MKKLFPTFFFWHGSPMSAIEDNDFSKTWKNIWKTIEKPNAILAISAHFETNHTYITTSENLKTIHDFYGFPEELFRQNYDVKWDKELAFDIIKNIPEIKPSEDFWLDHWVWSVLIHMFGEKNIPVLELSIDLNKSASEHFELWKKLKYLRENWVLVMWSWNIVHSLWLIDWYDKTTIYPWAKEFNENVKDLILKNDFEKLIDYKNLKHWDLAIQWKEHYLPMLYTLAMLEPWEKIEFFNDKIEMWSLSMTSFKIWE